MGVQPDVPNCRLDHLYTYSVMAIALAAVALVPHHHFHRFFSQIRDARIETLEEEAALTEEETERGMMRRILILLEKGDAEKLSPWLLDVKVVVELVLVAFMHVALVEILTLILHF